MVALISLADLKAELPIRSTDARYDAHFQSIIDAVSRQVEIFCRRSFTRQTFSEIHHVRDGARQEYDFYGDYMDGLVLRPSGQPFRLKQTPVHTGTIRVFYDLQHQFPPESELPSDRITVLADRGLVYINAALRKSRDSIRIDYEAGYEASGTPPTLSASLPADLKLAVLSQCVYTWKRLDSANIGMEGSVSADATASPRFNVQGGIIPDVVSLLMPYRRILRGRE